jgi:hypothetical protein
VCAHKFNSPVFPIIDVGSFNAEHLIEYAAGSTVKGGVVGLQLLTCKRPEFLYMGLNEKNGGVSDWHCNIVMYLFLSGLTRGYITSLYNNS